jgi:hypothetical protein
MLAMIASKIAVRKNTPNNRNDPEIDTCKITSHIMGTLNGRNKPKYAKYHSDRWKAGNMNTYRKCSDWSPQ